MTLFYLIALSSSLPLAIFGIVPNAIVADIVDAHQQETGLRQSGMFYAIAAFMMKVGVSVANLIFPSLLLLGKSVENPLGIRISVLCAICFCLAGFIAFRKYKEYA